MEDLSIQKPKQLPLLVKNMKPTPIQLAYFHHLPKEDNLKNHFDLARENVNYGQVMILAAR